MSSTDREALTSLAAELLHAPKRELFGVHTWTNALPTAPGVYALWERASGRPIYVGETANLRARMGDLGRFRNYICRRKLAQVLEMTGDDELALSAMIAQTHQLSFIVVWLGRVELEEFLSVKWAASLINRLGRRHLNRYSWVSPGER
jgi:hypothetical protein